MRRESSKSAALTTDERHIAIFDSCHANFARRTVNRVFVTSRRFTFKFRPAILDKFNAGYFSLKLYYFFARFGELIFKVAFFFLNLGEHFFNERKMVSKDDT